MWEANTTRKIFCDIHLCQRYYDTGDRVICIMTSVRLSNSLISSFIFFNYRLFLMSFDDRSLILSDTSVSNLSSIFHCQSKFLKIVSRKNKDSNILVEDARRVWLGAKCAVAKNMSVCIFLEVGGNLKAVWLFKLSIANSATRATK